MSTASKPFSGSYLSKLLAMFNGGGAMGYLDDTQLEELRSGLHEISEFLNREELRPIAHIYIRDVEAIERMQLARSDKVNCKG